MENEEKVKLDKKLDKAKDKISGGLKKQLKENDLNAEHYLSLIDDYASMWKIKEKLIADIDSRGVSVKWNNGGGQEGYRKNDSISELVRINAQMLRILSDLGLKGADIEAEEVYEPM